jgi:hypothetical protein
MISGSLAMRTFNYNVFAQSFNFLVLGFLVRIGAPKPADDDQQSSMAIVIAAGRSMLQLVEAITITKAMISGMSPTRPPPMCQS